MGFEPIFAPQFSFSGAFGAQIWEYSTPVTKFKTAEVVTHSEGVATIHFVTVLITKLQRRSKNPSDNCDSEGH